MSIKTKDAYSRKNEDPSSLETKLSDNGAAHAARDRILTLKS